MSETGFETLPTVRYGVALLMPAVALPVSLAQLTRRNGGDGSLARAIGNNVRGWISIVGYVFGSAAASINPLLGCALYAAAVMVWFFPDKRIERVQAT